MQKSFHEMKSDVGMHNSKNHRNKSLHSTMIVQSCVTPPCIHHFQVQGLRMIYYHLAMKTLVHMIFRIVHPYITLILMKWFLHLYSLCVHVCVGSTVVQRGSVGSNHPELMVSLHQKY